MSQSSRNYPTTQLPNHPIPHVIVVGAGPAGATAALTLARAGVTVRLLDRSKFPRNKPCGGGITLRVLRRFPYLEHELGRIATQRLSRLHLDAPVVVAADGVHSVVARRLGLNQGWPANAVALDMMEETPRESLRDLDPSTLWVAYGYRPTRNSGPDTAADESAAEGYAYIFPK